MVTHPDACKHAGVLLQATRTTSRIDVLKAAPRETPAPAPKAGRRRTGQGSLPRAAGYKGMLAWMYVDRERRGHKIGVPGADGTVHERKTAFVSRPPSRAAYP